MSRLDPFTHVLDPFTHVSSLYSLIETAKANGLELYAYLCYAFTQLPAAQSIEDFERLLPFNVTPEQIKSA